MHPYQAQKALPQYPDSEAGSGQARLKEQEQLCLGHDGGLSIML